MAALLLCTLGPPLDTGSFSLCTAVLCASHLWRKRALNRPRLVKQAVCLSFFAVRSFSVSGSAFLPLPLFALRSLHCWKFTPHLKSSFAAISRRAASQSAHPWCCQDGPKDELVRTDRHRAFKPFAGWVLSKLEVCILPPHC